MKVLILCLATAASLGCGSSVNVTPWVGSWTASVAQTETCSGSSGSHTDGLNGPIVIAAGSADGTIITQPANGCDLTWTVNGTSATLTANVTCPTVPASASAPGTWTATFTSGLLTLNSNTIGVSDSGSAIFTPTGDPAQNCTFNQSGSFSN
jgi:hypothetical protein